MSMIRSLKRHMVQLCAATLAIGSLAAVGANAAEPDFQKAAVLSANLTNSVGTVLTADEIMSAENTLSQNKSDAVIKAKAETALRVQKQAEAAAQAEAKAAAKAKQEAKAQAEADTEAEEQAQTKAEAEAKEKEKKKAQAQAEAKAQSKADAEALADAEAEEEEAQAKAEAEAKAAAQAAAEAQVQEAIAAMDWEDYEAIFEDEVIGRPVIYSPLLEVNDLIRENAESLGTFKLTFYCPCEECNGKADGKTASGTYMEEGRTIAVDTSVIPLGSRVYIDGYGIFIAEDSGHAIVDNRIDICVSYHERANELGVQSAEVYLLD